MNNNFMKSSVKAVAAALVASLAFTSCSKDQFTEKDALNLELSRLRAQRTIDSIKTLQDRTDRNALLRYQRALDSLDRENAGGRVFYTVNVVSATSSAVANGRTEEAEGVTGATVTTSQYGNVVSKTTQSGIATFELRSGEATVSVVAPAHTSADYTVNLTAPYGGGQTGNVGSAGAGQTAATTAAAKNGTTVYVGNVLPLFQISTDGAQMATIRGRAFIETDLTNDVEELANTQNAAIQAAGTVANIFVSAGIDTQGSGFFAKYLAKSGQYTTTGSNLGGTSTNQGNGIGGITKIFYGPATPTGASGSAGAPVNRVAVGATGDYTILVPATVSGLPIVIKSDEIVANRNYFRSDALGLGTLTQQRFLYGPNVVADAVDLGASIPRVSFQAFTTPATVTASYAPEVVSGTFNTGNYAGGAGFYAVTPSVAVAGTTGTGLTAGNTGNAPTGSVATATTNGAFVNVAANAFANLPTASTTAVGLSVSGVEISAGGTGYVAVAGAANDGVATFTRQDVVAVGSGFRVGGATGSQISTFIQVTDGGFGFVYPDPTSYVVATRTGGFANTLAGAFTTSGFTGTLPTVSFGNILAPALSPVALVIPEPSVGTITSIQVTSPGSGLASIPQPVFTYGTTGGLPPTDAAGDALFIQAGAGGIRFNFGAGALAAASPNGPYDMPAAWGTAGTDYTLNPTSIVLIPQTAGAGAAQATTLGSGYVFVPTAVASATGGGAFPSITPANFTVAVRTSSAFVLTAAQGLNVPQGAVQRIDISAPGNYTAAGLAGVAGAAITFPLTNTTPANLGTGIGLSLVAPSVPTGSSRSANSLAGLSFPGGSGLALDNYVITTATPSVTRGGVTPAAAANIFTAATASGYPSNATLVSSTLLNPNTFISPLLAANLLAGSAWIVAFDAPASGVQAWGIPYIDLVNGVSTISGVRIMDAGSGYPATATAVPMTLMPNPFRNTTASATTPVAIALTAMGPVDANNFFSVGTSTIAVKPNTNLVSALSNSGTIGFELPAVGATLTFTVTAAGSGYATTPRVVIADGGLTFQAIATALNPTLTGTAAASTDVGPVLMTGSATAGAGASVTRVGNTFTGAAANVGRINFAVGSDPKFLSAPAVFVIDELSAGLTNTYNNAVAAGAAAPMGGVVPAGFGAYTGVAKANLPAITIGANGAIIGLGSMQTATNQTAGQMSKLPEAFVLSADGLPLVAYHTSPVVTIAAPATGTAATAVIDPAGVETSTFIPGIRATGTNGTNAVAAVTGVTAVTAVAATAGNPAALNVTNTTGAASNLVIQTNNGSGATVVPTVASSTATIAAPTVTGTGILTTYTYSIPAGAQVLINAAGAAGTVAASITVNALNANTQNSLTAGTNGTAAVAGVTGVTAVTAAALVAGVLPGEIQAIRLTSGGSGYGRGNLFQRWFILNNGINQGTGNGQNYVVFGNEQVTGAGATTAGANVNGTKFEVMTGVTYVRDIHYGTGKRVD